MADRLEMVRGHWNNLAVRFTETANKRMTLQCSTHLHAHMQLDQAKNVLEVAAGAGLGSLDAVQYLMDGRSKLSNETKRTFTVTDLAPVMVELAEQNLKDIGSDTVEVKCQVANGSLTF
ncbi:hypothetical protein P3T76_012322 [Phytophthora citrophthora]|uniref:Methyltransferase domain-containing protein n=1 Tax=Phytophthora citrophthora TaxID=4793 RepID=A0AAD9G5T5_9STRA|nr:hypothetical protein P3T76_012322 [Phytophthora citrophthora]